MIDLGWVDALSTIRIPFSSFATAGGSVTMTNFAVGDILIYKDGNTTERASTSGFTATADFDGKTGKHLAAIDLNDNTTAGFYAVGSEYLVAIDAVTIDGQTTGGWIGRFKIGPQPANTTQISGTAQTGHDVGAKAASMTFTVAGKIDANALLVEGSDATDQIRDAILSDATRFAGADIAAIKGFIDTEIATLITNVGTVITNLAAAKVVIDAIDGHTDTEISSIISTLATVLGLIDTEVASILTAVNAIKVTSDKFVFTTANQVDAGVIDKTGFSLLADFRFKKNTAFATFAFPMKDAAGALVSGVTVTATRSIGNAATFSACANAVTEKTGLGIYMIDFAAADLNGDSIIFKFTAVGCVDRYVTIVTQTE